MATPEQPRIDWKVLIGTLTASRDALQHYQGVVRMDMLAVDALCRNLDTAISKLRPLVPVDPPDYVPDPPGEPRIGKLRDRHGDGSARLLVTRNDD